MTLTVQTVKLNGNARFAEVLARDTYEYGLSAVTYANRTQAEARQKKLEGLGFKFSVIHPRMNGPFYLAKEA